MSSPTELIFETRTRFKDWWNVLTVGWGIFCLWLFAKYLDGEIKVSPVIFSCAVGIFLVGLVVMLFLQVNYVFHISRKEFLCRYELFSFVRYSVIAPAEDILGIGVNCERCDDGKFELTVEFLHQAALGLKNGQVFPLTHYVKDGFPEALVLAREYAQLINVPFVEGGGQTYLEVFDPGNGTKVLVHRASQNTVGLDKKFISLVDSAGSFLPLSRESHGTRPKARISLPGKLERLRMGQSFNTRAETSNEAPLEGGFKATG